MHMVFRWESLSDQQHQKVSEYRLFPFHYPCLFSKVLLPKEKFALLVLSSNFTQQQQLDPCEQAYAFFYFEGLNRLPLKHVHGMQSIKTCVTGGTHATHWFDYTPARQFNSVTKNFQHLCRCQYDKKYKTGCDKHGNKTEDLFLKKGRVLLKIHTKTKDHKLV